MIVIDEYLAIRIVGRAWPAGLPDDQSLILPPSRHWRLLQRIHSPSRGQLSTLLDALTPATRDALRNPHPEVLQIIDTRPLLDQAARIAARHGGGWLTAETLAAGLNYGHGLWFGTERNVGPVVIRAANDLGIAIHVLEP